MPKRLQYAVNVGLLDIFSCVIPSGGGGCGDSQWNGIDMNKVFCLHLLSTQHETSKATLNLRGSE